MTLIRIISTIALASYLALAFIVARDIRRTAIRSFALFLFAMLFWQIMVTAISFMTDRSLALQGYRWVVGLGASFAVFYAQFTRNFVGVRTHRSVIVVGYSLIVLFALWSISGGPGLVTAIHTSPNTGMLLPEFGPVAFLGAAVLYGYLAYSAVLLFKYHQRTPSPLIQTRVKYLLVGLILVFLGSMANLSDDLQPYPFDMVANAINASLIAYAILRYKLLDISWVIRKGLVYSSLTLAITIVYFVVVSLAINILHVVTGYEIFVLTLFMAALTAVAILPLRDRVQGWVDQALLPRKARLERDASAVEPYRCLSSGSPQSHRDDPERRSPDHAHRQRRVSDQAGRRWRISRPDPEGRCSYSPEPFPVQGRFSSHQLAVALSNQSV